MERISIDVGLKTYEVCDADGNVLGTVTINPSDMGMVGRAPEAMENIQALAEKAKKVETDIKNSNEMDAAKTIAEIDRSIKEQIDYIFGSSVSDVLFGGVSCLTTCDNGSMVLENVLNALEPIIKVSRETANANRQKRIAAHTAKYAGHSAGLAPGQRV